MSELNDSRRWQFTMIYGILLFLSLKVASGIIAAILYELLISLGLNDFSSDWSSRILAVLICVLLAYYDSKGTMKKVKENPDRIKMLTYQMAGVFASVCFLVVIVFAISALFSLANTGEYITASYEVEYGGGPTDLGKMILSGAETVLILLAIGIRK